MANFNTRIADSALVKRYITTSRFSESRSSMAW